MAFLVLNDACKFFGGLKAVNEVSFEVKQGEIVGLIGPNGSGKTTAFNIISGTLPITSGTICFRDEDISKLKPHIRTRGGMARTFQGNRIFKTLTVRENIMTARQCHIKMSPLQAIFAGRYNKQLEEENEKRVDEILKFVGLEELADSEAGGLPFAHQAMVGIANALATDPTLLLLDEPLAGMNQTEAKIILDLTRKVRESGITVLLVEHNMRAIMSISDRIVVLNEGVKIAEGLPAEISKNPDVIRVYLGGGNLRD